MTISADDVKRAWGFFGDSIVAELRPGQQRVWLYVPEPRSSAYLGPQPVPDTVAVSHVMLDVTWFYQLGLKPRPKITFEEGDAPVILRDVHA